MINETEVETEENEVPEVFHITDERGAEWVLCKIREARERADRARKWAQEIAAEAQKREDGLMARFGVELQQFAQTQLEGVKKKSFALPSGTLGFRSSAATIVVREPDELQEWAKVHCPEAVQYELFVECGSEQVTQLKMILATIYKVDPVCELKESVTKSIVNEHFKTTGEVPEGCVFVPPCEKFYIK